MYSIVVTYNVQFYIVQAGSSSLKEVVFPLYRTTDATAFAQGQPSDKFEQKRSNGHLAPKVGHHYHCAGSPASCLNVSSNWARPSGLSTKARGYSSR